MAIVCSVLVIDGRSELFRYPFLLVIAMQRVFSLQMRPVRRVIPLRNDEGCTASTT
jgi:hypothetical protein